jgi:uncharacterized membrane protein YGL010W
MIKFRPVTELLANYSESHQHPTNELIHYICVPAITLSLLGVIHAWIPIAAWAIIGAGLAYYFFISKPLFLGVAATLLPAMYLMLLIPAKVLFWLSILVFIAAWIGQFYGHKIEGKKPSFFQDIVYLMVGPLFVLSHFYKRQGWRLV